jgi:transcription initiation factor IIE alpha subunit
MIKIGEVITCPDCDETFKLDEDFTDTDVIECPHCGSDLELNDNGKIVVFGEFDEGYDDDEDEDDEDFDDQDEDE